MSTLARGLFVAIRAPTLAASAVPIAVGSACAYAEHALRIDLALCAWLCASLLQIASNLANDLGDFERGADGEDRLGPTRAVQAGLVAPRVMRIALIVTLGLAVLSGSALVAQGGAAILVLGAASLLAAVAYTMGPFPLAYVGLGDVFVLAFFGFVGVAGSAFVQLGRVPTSAWLASLGVGAIATSLLVVNNVRDRETDARVGKRTLAVRFGRRGAMIEYVALLGVAYGVPFALRSPSALLPLLTLPFAIALARGVLRDEGRALNRRLAQTAQLLLGYGALLALGIGLS